MYSASKREVGEHSNKVHLELGAEFFSGYLEGQYYLLETGILGSASDRDLLIKNMGFCYRCSSSLNKATLTET